MLQKIVKLKENDENGIFNNIYEIVDESDRQGTRAVIKLKKDTNVNKIISMLYKSSDLQTNFNVNMVAIADGKPKLLNLIDIIKYYVNYQKDVIFKRSKYDLEVSVAKAHILEGLIVAIKNIDDVIKIIKESKSTIEAKKSLMEKFILTDVQAQAILDMRLARLTNLEVNKIVNELKILNDLIVKLNKIIASDKLQFNLVKTELLEIKDKYLSERKSLLIDDDEDLNKLESSVVLSESSEYVNVIYSALNTLKQVNTKSYNMASKELGVNANLFEIPSLNLLVQSNKMLYLFTNLGNCHKIKVSDIPSVKFKDKGEFVYNLIKNFLPNETVVSMFDFDENNKTDKLVFVTKSGMIKISNNSEYFLTKQTISAIKLKENDELINVFINNENESLIMFTNMGYCVNVLKNDISLSSRTSIGVKGINLSANDYVINAYQNNNSDAYALFTSNGYAKVIKQSEIEQSARNRKGDKVISTKVKNLMLTNAFKLDRSVSFVTVNLNGELNYVLNKKMVLDNKSGLGKMVLNTKDEIVKVYKYTVI
jgi:DNA gyrase subunit A